MTYELAIETFGDEWVLALDEPPTSPRAVLAFAALDHAGLKAAGRRTSIDAPEVDLGFDNAM
ncbi:hypothetical protein [Plantactinospora sonchi]|uniref:Uncharacterized protein n=1 Tax=Plantactinospora sonchi TaxID=1544735 RepID=A0ABU7S279_9ACTN